MAGAIVQSGDLGSSASASSISLAFGSNNAASNVLFVFGHANDQSDALTPNDSRGNTYTVLDNLVDSVDNHKTQHACVVTSSAGANTVTYGVSPNSDFLGIYIAELSGLQNVAADAHKAVQQSAPGTGSNAVTTGAVTTTATDFCMAVTKVNGGAGTISVGTGFTQDTNAGGFSGWGAGVKMMVEFKASVASGTPAATFTSSSGSANYLTHAAWFKESGGGAHTSVATDTISLSDSAVSVTQRISVAIDTLTLSDSAVSTTTRLSDATDALTLSDSAVSVTQRLSVAVDSLTLTDSAIASHSAHSPTATDTLSLSDSAVSVTNRISVATDSITLSDSAVAHNTVAVAVAADFLSLSDSAICVSSAARPTPATPGRKLRLPYQVKGETEEEKRRRRIAQGIIREEASPKKAEASAKAINREAQLLEGIRAAKEQAQFYRWRIAEVEARQAKTAREKQKKEAERAELQAQAEAQAAEAARQEAEWQELSDVAFIASQIHQFL